MLSEDQLNKIVSKLAQIEIDTEAYQRAKAQLDATWEELVQVLREFGPEDADRERVIEAYKSIRGGITANVIRNIHRAYL